MEEIPCVTIVRAIRYWQPNSKFPDDKDFMKDAARPFSKGAPAIRNIRSAATVAISIQARQLKEKLLSPWMNGGERARLDAAKGSRRQTGKKDDSVTKGREQRPRYRNANHVAGSLKLRPYSRTGREREIERREREASESRLRSCSHVSAKHIEMTDISDQEKGSSRFSRMRNCLRHENRISRDCGDSLFLFLSSSGNEYSSPELPRKCIAVSETDDDTRSMYPTSRPSVLLALVRGTRNNSYGSAA